MLATLVIWLFIFMLLYHYGSVVLLWLNRILKLDFSGAVDIPLALFVGLIAVTTIASIGNLFVPLDAVFMTVLTIGAFLIALRKWGSLTANFPSYSMWVWIFWVLAFITVLENSTHVPTNPDTGLYHVQTARWFESYRIVPGLGNLQMRYAFNSSWLVLNSAFSFSFLGLRSFHLMNGVIFLSALYYFSDGLQALMQKRISVSGLLKVFFLPLSFYLLGSETSSIGNDMPVTLIIWLVVVLWVEKIETPLGSRLKSAVLFLLCFFAATVKLSSFPVIFFALFILIEHLVKKEWHLAIILAVMGGSILLTWMIRSVFLSGYLVFPQLQIDLFPVDWKMPRERVELSMEAIIGLARIGNDWRPSMDLSFGQWVPRWFGRLTLNRQALLLLAMISPLLTLAGRNKYPSVVSKQYILAFSTVLISLVFWFVSAPDIRFGYGFLIPVCMLALVPFILALLGNLEKVPVHFPKLILLSLFVFQLYVLVDSFKPSTFSQRWLLPADYPPSSAQPCDMNGVEIYCRAPDARWTACFYDLFPCIPSHYPDVEMRGLTFQDGFRPKLNFGP